MAVNATFALKAGVWFRRGRLLIICPGRGDCRRCQAETPLIVLCRFPGPAQSLKSIDRPTIAKFAERHDAACYTNSGTRSARFSIASRLAEMGVIAVSARGKKSPLASSSCSQLIQSGNHEALRRAGCLAKIDCGVWLARPSN
jgi:hypothetical protein